MGLPDVRGFGTSRGERMPSLHVVLVEPEIHWNTGNIGRTTLATGAELHLIEPLGFSLSSRYLRRAGLDYWPRVKVRVWPDFATFEATLPSLGEPFYFSGQGQRLYFDVDYPDDTVLIFGRESVGLPASILDRNRDRLLRIPMQDPALRSLNVSTAAGAAMLEVVRQRTVRTAGSASR